MPSFFLSTFELLIGIGLLFGGGELFVQGSVALALILGIPQLIIGLTVVALGTSAPELFVSVSSVIKGSDSLAVSNVVGSNIFNVLVVLGMSSLILPLKVQSRLVRRDVPLLIVISTAAWGMASTGKVTWQSGLALFVALCINTIWEIRTVREEPEGVVEAEPQIDVGRDSSGIFKAIINLFAGIILLTFGSNLLVAGASSIAQLLGVSEAVIGLTIVSAGTSLPELCTSIVAALKGRTDLAIGNVIGSCLLNQLLVLSSASIAAGKAGLFVNEILIQRDLPFMVLTTFACLPIFWTNGKITRLEGGILVGLYMFYITDQVLPKTLPHLQDEFRMTVVCLVMPILFILTSYQSTKYWIEKRTGKSR